MSDDKKTNDHPDLTIKAGAWIGIAGIALTMILALFGAAGWIVTRIDRVNNRVDALAVDMATRIDRVDSRVDALAVDIATRIDRVDSRVDALAVDIATRIDRVDSRVDALAVDMARMSGQLDLILQQGLDGQAGPVADSTSPNNRIGH